MRYVQGLAVAVLILAAYLVAEGGMSTPPLATPSPPPAAVAPATAIAPATPDAVLPPQIAGSPLIIGTMPPSPRPTHHVLHSGPPLH